MNFFPWPRLLMAALTLPLAVPAEAQAHTPTVLASASARGPRDFRLVAPVVSFEGVRVDAQGATLAQEPFAVLSLALDGYGTFYVSDRPFDGAQRAGEFDGSLLAFAADGRSVRVRSAEAILGASGVVPAFARFDAHPAAGPPLGRVPRGRLVLGVLSAPGVRPPPPAPRVEVPTPPAAPSRATARSAPAARPAAAVAPRPTATATRRTAPRTTATPARPRVARPNASRPNAVRPVPLPAPTPAPAVVAPALVPPPASTPRVGLVTPPAVAAPPVVPPAPPSARATPAPTTTPLRPSVPARRDTIPSGGTAAPTPAPAVAPGPPTWTGSAATEPAATPPPAAAAPAPSRPAPAAASWVLPSAELVAFDYRRVQNAEEIWLALANLPIPPILSTAQATGDVLVLFVTDESGAVVRTEVARGLTPALNQVAEDLVRQMRFIPTLIGGLPSALRSQVTVRYAL